MATLDEANDTALAAWEATFTKAACGIDCNSCGTELDDTHPGLTIKASPPQTQVECPGCGYKGYRII